ncbi:uncharacterized protein AB9W97_019055 isoform 1-T4 [Spinachia spinachia]
MMATCTTQELLRRAREQMENQVEPAERVREWGWMKRYLAEWQKNGWFPTVSPPAVEDRRTVWREAVTARNQATTAYEGAGRLGKIMKGRALQKEKKRCARTRRLLAYWKAVDPATPNNGLGLPEEAEGKELIQVTTPHSPNEHAVHQLYPELTKDEEEKSGPPPPYVSKRKITSPNPFVEQSVQAPMVRVRGGELDLESADEEMTSMHRREERVCVRVEEMSSHTNDEDEEDDEGEGDDEKEEEELELHVTSGNLKVTSSKIWPQRHENGERGEGPNCNPRRHSTREKKTPNRYADYILPVRSRSPTGSPVAQYPLLRKTNGQREFVPWSHRDMETMEKELPPLGEGANPWILHFETQTTADKLALGDVRALIARLEGTVNLEALEVRAKTTNLNDKDPFDEVRGAFCKAMLDTLEMKPGEEIFQYVRRAETEWRMATGERHNKDRTTAVIWRHTVQKGLPKAVQTALEGVVGLNNKKESDWKDHLTHFYKIYRATEKSDKEDMEKLTQRLLKAQVADIDAEGHKRKQAKKQLLVSKEHPQYPIPPEATEPARGQAGGNRLRGYQQQQYRGRGRGSGMRFSQQGGGDECFICGQLGHWSRTCPVKFEGNRGFNALPRRFSYPIQPRQNYRMAPPQPPPPQTWAPQPQMPIMMREYGAGQYGQY